ncbi:hypothetical protein FQZ97_1039290 [compost metagenome]
MSLEVHGYNASGAIAITLDGVFMVVGDDMGNRDRQMIWEEWEHDAEGNRVNTILAHIPPAPNPFPNLEPDQFWFVVRASGYEPDLRAWVANLNDPGTELEPNPNYNPVAWAEASAKLDFAKHFERAHPFIEDAREAIGMTVAELDALWQFAAG